MKTSILLATVSAAANKTTIGYDLGDSVGYSLASVVSGADVVGTLSLEVSLDNTSYVEVPSSSQSIAASADYIYSVSDAQYRYVRAKWVYTSGTGNITITIVVKDPYLST